MNFTVLGLTGGSGAGKGVAGEYLRLAGIPTLDTDLVSRAVCGAGMPCTLELADAFGGEILADDGTLRRKALAALVFGVTDVAEKQKRLGTLNTITHRYILGECRGWLSDRRFEGFRCACIDAPQLFESGFDTECDRILSVTADREIRIARLTARDGITREAAEQRIRAQHDDGFFRTHTDCLLENNSDPAALRKQLYEVLLSWGLLAGV